MEFSVLRLSKFHVPPLASPISINKTTTELFVQAPKSLIFFLFHLTHHEVVSILLIKHLNSSTFHVHHDLSWSYFHHNLLAFIFFPSKTFHTTRELFINVNQMAFPTKIPKTTSWKHYMILLWQAYPTLLHLSSLDSFNIVLSYLQIFVLYCSYFLDCLLFPQSLSEFILIL